MRKRMGSEGFWALVAVSVLWVAGFALACRLGDNVSGGAEEGESVLGRLLGGSRDALSEELYLTADLYFHRGVPHQSVKVIDDVFQEWAREVQPSAHEHARGEYLYEIMPWLRFATQMDPHNVEAYVVAAYWMGEGRDPDVGLAILQEALRHNRDYRLYSEKARLHMILQEGSKAARALDAGIRLWPSEQDPKEKQVRLELARMLTYRAFLHELDGEAKQALELFRRSREMFPDNKALARQVEMLEKGEITQSWAQGTWKVLFPAKMQCARGEVHEHEHEHEHGHEGEHEHGPSCAHEHGHDH